MFRQRTQPNPQNLVETLNSEEPSSPTPSIPGPELWVGPAAQVGLAWPNYGKLPARSHWRQSQEHCCPGSQARTAAAEDGRAVGCLFEVFFHASTAAFTWETAGAQTRGVEFRGFLCTMPKALYGRPLKPQTEPMANREAHGHTMSYLPGIPHLPSSALKCPSQGTRPSLPPHVVAQRVPEYVVAQKAPGCNRSSRGRAVIESHRAFGFLGEAAFSGEAASFGAPSRLQKMQSEAPKCSCNGRSPTTKSR